MKCYNITCVIHYIYLLCLRQAGSDTELTISEIADLDRDKCMERVINQMKQV